MPDPEIVVADTSVLIAFEKLDKLELLCLAYDKIILTEAVFNEYSNDLQHCFSLEKAPTYFANFLVDNIGIGQGEAESISLSYNTKITILLDDLKARKCAVELGCNLSGAIGVLYKMESKQIIESAFNEILTLKSLGFRISDKLIKKLS